MTYLPIVARELRVTARRSKTYWSRMLVAAVMLLIASWVFLMSYRQPSATQALALFGTLAGGMVFVGAISGIGATADSLSSEKREGTLGLLFLTPLRGYDVVLGKLFAGSLTVFYGMMSVTPILALPLLMGGVGLTEFARMALLMVNTMLFSLAIGICVSSISRDEKRARSAALLVVILFAAGFPLIGAYLEGELHLRGLAQWFMLSSPGYAFAGAWDKTISTSWMGYWASMLTLHLLTWCFLVLACWFTPRTWQDRPARKKWRPASLLGFRMAGLEQSAVDFRRRMLDLNAFFWLTARPRFKPGIVWAILIGLTGIWLGGGVKYPNEMFDPSMYVVMALLWNTVLKVWMTSEATRQVAQDRKSGSIELLLSTAITVRDIASGQWLSLRRQLGWPLLAVVAAELLLVFLGMKEVGGREDRVVWCAVWLCGLAMLIADLVTIPTVGLWQSAVARGPAEAAGATAFRILALPWILYMLLGAMVAVADGLGILRNLPNLEWVFWLGGWVFLGFLVNLFFGLRSWRAVHSRFREVASQRGGRGWGHALGRLFETFRAQGRINR